jgi:membrane protein YdbS with pleckstrin-like domain
MNANINHFSEFYAMNTLDPSVKSVWGIGSFIRTVFYSGVLFLAEIIVAPLEFIKYPPGLIAGSIFLFGIIVTVIIPPLKYKFYRFDVRENDLLLEHGIFTRVKTIIPYRRMQHTDVSQGIIERSYGLARLVVYTAGTRVAAAVIPGLPIDYAEQLRDHLRSFVVEGDAL